MSNKNIYPLVFNDVSVLCENDQANILHAVLKQHPSLVKITNINGRTLLHHAAESGSWGCVDALIGHGADVNAVDNTGETPLHRAMSRRRLEASKVLLEAGADPNIKNFHGATATLYSAMAGPDNLSLVLEYGGDNTVVDNSGDDISYWAKRGNWLLEQEKKTSRLKP